jgi:hypothetical protein
VQDCSEAISFINDIIEKALGFPASHYKQTSVECINAEFLKILNSNLKINNYQQEGYSYDNKYLTAIHSTNEMIRYIIDVYSPEGMYNINSSTTSSNISIDYIENYINKTKPGKQQPTNKVLLNNICRINYDNNTNFSLKTILNIIKMFKDRKNLAEYTFVKCIKATTRVKAQSTNFSNTFMRENLSEFTEINYKSNPVKYADKIIKEQLDNLGINLILSIEPKQSYTLFKNVSGAPDALNINNLIKYINKYYYKDVHNNTFQQDDDFSNEKNFITLEIRGKPFIKHTKTNIVYHKTKHYEAAGKSIGEAFTIKKFLENIFRLYNIIPNQTEE